MLKEYNFIVRVNFTVTHLNQMEIFEAFKLCNTLGVDTFSISHVYDLNKGQNLYEKVDFLTYINEINKCINYAGKFKTELKPFIPVEFFSYVSEKKEFSEVIIEDKTSLLTWFINSSGDIYPDVTLELNEFYIGNIYNDDLEDIYMNIKKIAKKMTKRDLRSSKCSYCNNVNICKGGDLGRTYKRYSNFNQADPRCSFKYKVR